MPFSVHCDNAAKAVCAALTETAGERDHLPTRTLIHILIAHDFYHTGEINHLRALIEGTDRRSHGL